MKVDQRSSIIYSTCIGLTTRVPLGPVVNDCALAKETALTNACQLAQAGLDFYRCSIYCSPCCRGEDTRVDHTRTNIYMYIQGRKIKVPDTCRLAFPSSHPSRGVVGCVLVGSEKRFSAYGSSIIPKSRARGPNQPRTYRARSVPNRVLPHWRGLRRQGILRTERIETYGDG